MVSRGTPRFLWAIILIVLVVTGGTLGYILIEEWPAMDALYMALITLTTVGFGEVNPLSEPGKLFTIAYLIFGVLTVGFSISSLISYLFEGQVHIAVKERKMRSAIKRLNNHYIICGCGDIGREVAFEFIRKGTPFVVIDRDPSHSELAEEEEVLFIEGDASEEHILAQGKIETAKGLIAALPSDADNVFISLTARQMNPSLTIVSKATDQSASTKLRRAGADRVISPSQIAGRRIASTILRPSVVNFLDVIVEDSQFSMRLEEFRIEAGSSMEGKTLREADIGQHTGAIVLAIADSAGSVRVDTTRNVVSGIRMQAKDRVIAMGSSEQLASLEKLLTST
ncbi:MAG: potassium channel protein [Spirochaetales bacterium]|nr:potassium channel protein [Spirochaetales bacterium]MCF7938316.1 potassium channel protein [Spirochaetales bacterium]